MYYVYMILCADKSVYTGITMDVNRRFAEHKEGKGGNYTRSHKPKKLLYREEVETRSEALKREAEIKSWSHEQKLKFVKYLQ